MSKMFPVLRCDAELREAVPAAQRASAERAAIAPGLELAPGRWLPSGLSAPRDLGFLVIDGLLTRRIPLAQRTGIELLGAGDLLRPWDEDLAPLSEPAVWSILQPTRMASLDAAFAQRIAPWPEVVSKLMARAIQRSRWLACNLAIMQQARVDERLLLLFWQLAHRWGKVTRDGVLIPMSLTHGTLADLVGARRPTVTTALGSLEADGRVRRAPEAGWLLVGRPPSALDDILGQSAAPAPARAAGAG